MSRIHVLSEEVAYQIAAGEVVERPVSIVKELMENSLDAGADKIEVTFRHGGKYYISVLDNGSGMTPEEASLCLERHATSKLNYASDLNTICSFGFRGEAIPSIASVSRFNLRTRYKEDNIGTEILINGGKLLHKKEIGMPIGTQIEVLNLFNTVPARRKFMKSEATESAHIINLVRLYAIAHRDISFTLYEGDRELFKVAGSNSLKDRVKAVWGKRLIEDLTEFKAEEEGLRAYGLLSKPGVGRSTRQEMIIIVNGRPVDCKTISYALIESYHTYVPKGRYPVLFFFLEIDPEMIDVNVHPAKREIRLRSEGQVRQFIIKHVLEHLKGLSTKLSYPSEFEVNEAKVPVFAKTEPVAKEINIIPKPSRVLNEVKLEPVMVNKIEPVRRVVLPEKKEAVAVIEKPIEKKIQVHWEFKGFLKDGNFFFEGGGGVIVLNQKGAQQRVLYEQFIKGFLSEGIVSQRLLLPIPFELEAMFASTFGEYLIDLNKNGFSIVEFGRNFYRIESIPLWLDCEDVERFVKDLAALIYEQGGVPKDKRSLNEKVAKLAVIEAAKVKSNLNQEEAEMLVENLFQCENPLTCPRGYATYFEMPFRDMDNRFGR